MVFNVEFRYSNQFGINISTSTARFDLGSSSVQFHTSRLRHKRYACPPKYLQSGPVVVLNLSVAEAVGIGGALVQHQSPARGVSRGQGTQRATVLGVQARLGRHQQVPAETRRNLVSNQGHGNTRNTKNEIRSIYGNTYVGEDRLGIRAPPQTET